MDPSVIKKIQDQRKEKTRPEGVRIPVTRELPHSEKQKKSPEKSGGLKKDAPAIIEIQVS